MATDYLNNYLDRIKSEGNVELANSIQNTSESFDEKYLSHFFFSFHEVGLLFGNVQSLELCVKQPKKAFLPSYC